MKILAQAKPHNTLAGFQRAVVKAGHQWVWWEEEHTPAFDVFDSYKPDILFCMEDYSRAVKKCIEERKIPFVIGHYDDPFTFTVQPVDDESIRLAYGWLADTNFFKPSVGGNNIWCELGVVAAPNPTIINLCFNNLNTINIKIMYEEPWKVAQYIGVPKLEDKRNLYNISLAVFVDTVLEAMRVIACGSIPITIDQELSDCVNGDIPLFDKDKHDDIADYIHMLSNNSDYYKDIQGQLSSLTQPYDYALNTGIFDVLGVNNV